MQLIQSAFALYFALYMAWAARHTASEPKKVRAPRWLATPDPFLEIRSYWCAQGTPTYFCSATE